MIVLEDYINRSVDSSDIRIERVPTYSKHATLSKKILNELLVDNPNYFDLIKAIVVFPVQKWAYTSRNRIGLDPFSLGKNKAIQDAVFFGMKSEDWLANQKRRLELSDEMLLSIEKWFKGDAVKAIHGFRKKDVSDYIVLTRYKDEMIDICSRHNESFGQQIRLVAEDINSLEDDIQFVFRDFSWLMKVIPLIINKSNDRGEISYDKMVDKLDQCIGCLDSYYLKDPLMKQVARLYSRGVKELTICKQLGKSRSYVRRMKEESAEALSCLIWGYFNL